MNDSNAFHSEELPGGTIRVSASVSTEGSIPVHHETNRVHNGVIRADGSGQFARASATEGNSAPGVMGTLRNNMGSARIDSTSTVELPGGMRTSLAVAESLGFIRKDANGRYEDVEGAGQGGQEQDQQQQQQAGPELAPPAEEAAFAEAIQPLRQDSYDAAVAMASLAVTEMHDIGAWQSIADRLVSSEGMEPDAAAALVEKGHAFFSKQVDRMVIGLGVEEGQLDEVYEWLQENRPEQLTQATQQLLMQRSLSGFRGLALEWKSTQGQQQLAFWRNQGFDAFVNRDDGEVYVRHDGGQPVQARKLMKG